MPRRKQGHSKESATGGFIKKKTDPGLVLIKNETFKHYSTNNDLVFKIKKTVSSNIPPPPTNNEKIEREHIEASKSLNDINMVSQPEVNNNIVKNVQDENKVSKNEIGNCGVNSDSNGNERPRKSVALSGVSASSVLNMSVNNSFSSVSTTKGTQKQTSFLNAVEFPVQRAGTKSPSLAENTANGKSESTKAVSPQTNKGMSCIDTINDNAVEAEKQSAEVSVATSLLGAKEGTGIKAESQQMDYRISASENMVNYSKEADNPVLEQNCQLPSSVYGSPASSIEKVLTGFQMSEQNGKNNLLVSSKTSFLQEILEKKSGSSASNLSEDKNNTNGTKSCAPETSAVTSISHSSSVCSTESKDTIKTDASGVAKLKLHIPDCISNDDSNSSVLSTESQKTLKFPKITSPQILEQHISKIISENAAIVDTLEPMWSRRYFKQTSQNSSSSHDGDSKKISGKGSRSNDDKILPSALPENSSKSKLHSALLGGCEGEGLHSTKTASTSASVSVISSKDKSFSQFGNLTTVPSINMYSKRIPKDDLKGSAIKGLLNFRQNRYPKHKKSFSFVKDMGSQHPQNPEGSIIKDLLLKSKSQEDLKADSELDDRGLFYSSSISSDAVNDLAGKYEKRIITYKCSQCLTEFPNKYNRDVHLSFCHGTNPLLYLRDATENFRLKETSAQSKPLGVLDFQSKMRGQSWEEPSKIDPAFEKTDDEVGPILKKQLLMPRSPPMKRRKVSDSLLLGSNLVDSSLDIVQDNSTTVLNNLDILPHQGRSQIIKLFGGEVQVNDEATTKKIKIKTTLPGAFSTIPNKFSNAIKKPKTFEDIEMEKDSNSSPGVIVTIAQHKIYSGATVHLPTRRSTSNISPVVAISSVSDSIPKYPKVITSSVSNFSRLGYQLESFKPSSDHKESASYPCDFFPGPDSKPFSIPLYASHSSKSNDMIPGSVVDEISPGNIKVTLSPGNKPFYSPIFPATEKSFDLPVSLKPKEKSDDSQPIVPTVLFTPSSPTMPPTDNENAFSTASSISEPTKKFLAPARPTSLPLKKKPFTMVSSTLVSPDTPRPKKSCVQMYLNGHAYTYLGLKCSTRSTYCCIYRPQPMFVPQETNPKLSMYSNWQVVPAKEELSGLTPGQMISLYCSKQKDSKAITVNSRVGEPLTFTHSSYWTYRSQDHSESNDSSKLKIQSNEVKELKLPSESSQDSVRENSRSDSVISSHGTKTEKHVLSADESSLHVDTENTLSDEANNSNDEDDDDDCQDDGTESLTDSSQPQPPKRVKIFEGGFKSNEDYTYVRGRGRGKYVCEECGIRCKKPSMLKKHIRTHTDLRPYKCRHCSFAFKTKGNLTKHMKSKAHHKKCTELGIIPVPTTTDDSQIDEEALAKQIEKKKIQFSDGEDADDDDDEDSDESEDECESDASSMMSSNQQTRMLANGHSDNPQDKLSSSTVDEIVKETDSISQQTLEQEAVRSLLNLSALGEPSQWSTSTGDLTDVTSSSETQLGSSSVRSDLSLVSPSQMTTHMSVISSRPKNISDQWLSVDTLGHRPRSYSADVPQSSGKDALSKFKLSRIVNSDTLTVPVDESSEFGGREQYTRRYSISVAREARKPHVLTPEWSRLENTSQKWPEGETSDQPMDLSITRDLSKCKSVYAAGIANSLLNIVSEGNGPESNLDAFGESYQLKSLPVLSPQMLVDYEAGCSNSAAEASLLPLTDDQTTLAPGTSTRTMYYVQDVPSSDTVSSRKDADVSDDPPSPDISDYAVCSPVSPPPLEDSSYYYSQENMSQPSTNSEDASSSRFRAEFIVPTSSGMEEGKCVCRICNKTFAKSSHLRLHVNIHYFERPFRCENCAVSFRTKGHLQKHKRSVSHYNKVNMNMTFGTPTVDNPRPFKCADCKIAFRIHGHLAKHLRSKMHIMKLECLGKLPFGMYAEMERSGISLNEIDTTDCSNSLDSLQNMAKKLYQRDPRRMRWQGPEQTTDFSCMIPATPASTLIDSMLPMNDPMAANFDSVGVPASTFTSSVHPLENEEVKQELAETMVSAFSESDNTISSLPRFVVSQPSAASNQESVQRIETSERDSTVSLHRSGTCHICSKTLKSAKFLQVHLYTEHPTWNPSSTNEASSPNSSISSVSNSHELVCKLCGKQYTNQKELQQHLLSHAQPRPFVCELCDAGFTSSSSLVAHKATHQNNSSISSNVENRSVQLK